MNDLTDQGPAAAQRSWFRVHSYEAGADERLTLRSLCNYLQEAAGSHARALGVSMERLGEQGLAWVLRRLRVRQPRPVARGTRLEVRTWPSRFDGVVAPRHFLVFDEQGAELVRSVSEWVVVDLERRRVTRIPEWVQEIRLGEPGAALELEGRTLPRLEPDADAAVLRGELRVPRAAIDVVGHVTNSQYVEWLTEPMEEAFVREHRPVELDIQFQRESLWGEVLTTAAWSEASEAEAGLWHHRIEGANGERVRARTLWRRDG